MRNRWRGCENIRKTRVDRLSNRLRVVKHLEQALPAGYRASEQMCVMMNYDLPKPPPRERIPGRWYEPAVARSYGRKVIWFKPDDEWGHSGELILVGDAGKGKGWHLRMGLLFEAAVSLWENHRREQWWSLT